MKYLRAFSFPKFIQQFYREHESYDSGIRFVSGAVHIPPHFVVVPGKFENIVMNDFSFLLDYCA